MVIITFYGCAENAPQWDWRPWRVRWYPAYLNTAAAPESKAGCLSPALPAVWAGQLLPSGCPVHSRVLPGFYPLHTVPLKCDNQKTSPDIAKCHKGRGGDKTAPGWELLVSHSTHKSNVRSLWRLQPEAQKEEHFSPCPPAPFLQE